jgi:hypothetical protein
MFGGGSDEEKRSGRQRGTCGFLPLRHPHPFGKRRRGTCEIWEAAVHMVDWGGEERIESERGRKEPFFSLRGGMSV